MPLNPLIPLMVEQQDPLGQAANRVFSGAQALGNLEAQRLQREALEREAELFPLQQQLAEQRVAAGGRQQFTEEQDLLLNTLFRGAVEFGPMLERGDVMGAQQEALRLRDTMEAQGLPTEDIDDFLFKLETGGQEAGMVEIQDMLRIGQQMGLGDTGGAVQFGAQQTFKDEQGNLFFGTTRRSPETGAVESVLAPIGGGVAQPVGKVSLVSTLGQTAEEKIESEAQTAGAKEAAKLKAQFKLKPEVESAVAGAIASVKADAEKVGEARSNELALNTYDTAMSGLVNALGETTTGPIAGWLPAVTADQQVAEGAVAAMAPVLKQMFRSAGEGTFTDKDQELLLQMVPTRKDLPEARVAKINNIDAIVRAKLGRPPEAAEIPPNVGRFQIRVVE